MMEAVGASETVNLCETTLRNIPEDNRLYVRRRENLKSHLSDAFPIPNDLKQGDALSPLLFNYALKYVYH
jgi:hypothetical protein